MEVSSASVRSKLLKENDVFLFLLMSINSTNIALVYLDLHNYLSNGYCRMSFEELRDVGLLKLSYNEGDFIIILFE